MFEVYEKLDALNETNSSKVKLNTLKSFTDDKLLEKVFKYAYDKVDYTYGVTPESIEKFDVNSMSLDDIDTDPQTLEDVCYNMFSLLDALNARKFTGHSALRLCKSFVMNCKDEKELFYKILDRDLKVGINENTLNKVWKGIVPRPSYCRCGVLSKKLADKINFPCYLQLKCDGTYRECKVENGKVSFKTRSGEPYSDPILEKDLSVLPDGYYTGEFTVGKADEPNANRSVGNGMINSENPDFKNIHFTVWDYLTAEEYRGDVKTPYGQRFVNLQNNLRNINSELIHVVPSYDVNSLSEALKITSDFMNQGLEGGVLKDKNMIFKNGTSNQQLKIKLKVDADLRCTGFIKGTKGTKYENLNKVIVYQTDDGKIKGQCSGMTDDMIEEVTAHPEKYIGGIVAVQFNDLIKAEGRDYHALSHPRFVCFRDDKYDSDTYERVIEMRDMARSLS